MYKTVRFGAHAEAIKPIADARIPKLTASLAPNESTNEPLKNPEDTRKGTVSNQPRLYYRASSSILWGFG